MYGTLPYPARQKKCPLGVSHTAPFYGALVVPNVNAATCTEIARAPYFAQAVTSCAHELLFASCFGRPHRTQNGNSFVTPIARPSCVDAKTDVSNVCVAQRYPLKYTCLLTGIGEETETRRVLGPDVRRGGANSRFWSRGAGLDQRTESAAGGEVVGQSAGKRGRKRQTPAGVMHDRGR
jgi:hypothetical protein